jgi:hypothetical protein
VSGETAIASLTAVEVEKYRIANGNFGDFGAGSNNSAIA